MCTMMLALVRDIRTDSDTRIPSFSRTGKICYGLYSRLSHDAAVLFSTIQCSFVCGWGQGRMVEG